MTLIGAAAAIASPLLHDRLGTAVAISGGVMALIGSAISIYTGHVQGEELKSVRELAKPRRLTAADLPVLVENMRAFSGQKFELYVHDHDESRRFSEELATCLVAAGWEQVKPRGDVLTGDGMTNIVDLIPTGIIVGGPSGADNAAAAKSLATHLKSLGFEAKAEQHLEFDRFPDRTHVYVGMKVRGLPDKQRSS